MIAGLVAIKMPLNNKNYYKTCSALICVYRKDNPTYLRAALKSILNQTLPPNDIVLSIDGPIGNKLDSVIREFCQQNPQIQVLRLPRNVGVGQASNAGLKLCKNELVAKMDPDDIAMPKRLELQVAAFNRDPKLTVLGGQLAEFVNNDPKQIIAYRKVPTSLSDIKHFARRRSPFNNQTVMYKKSVIMALGAYPKLNRGEDYYLFSKVIVAGYKVKNLPDTLALFRLDDEAYRRRKTWRHTKENITARYQIHKLGLMRRSDFILTSAAQLGVFILPTFLVRDLYKLLRHK